MKNQSELDKFKLEYEGDITWRQAHKRIKDRTMRTYKAQLTFIAKTIDEARLQRMNWLQKLINRLKNRKR